jgi:hypothetical protein
VFTCTSVNESIPDLPTSQLRNRRAGIKPCFC